GRFASLTPFPSGTDPSSQALIMDWFGNDDQENIATVNFTTGTAQLLQIAPVSGDSLTIDGDQFGAGYGDTVTVGRAANGNVQVPLNGQVFEYTPSALKRITVNTGAGDNTVNVLASFAGIALTINGGGTDRLSFGPSPPASITYTPDPSGLPGYGTLNAGGI